MAKHPDNVRDVHMSTVQRSRNSAKGHQEWSWHTNRKKVRGSEGSGNGTKAGDQDSDRRLCPSAVQGKLNLAIYVSLHFLAVTLNK